MQALFFSRKKKYIWWRATIRGALAGRRSTLGQPTVNLRSTYGQGWVSSLAIAGRFSLILPDSSIKTEDRRTCISQMVDFPIRKRDFRVRSWSGAFWEPQERKKEKTKCSYKICNPLHRSRFKILEKNLQTFSYFSSEFYVEFCKNRYFQHFYRTFNWFWWNFVGISWSILEIL